MLFLVRKKGQSMGYREISKCFPLNLKEKIEQEISINNMLNEIEEIRIRNSLPIIFHSQEKEIIINYKVKSEDISYILQKICENSIYAYQNQIINRIYYYSRWK